MSRRLTAALAVPALAMTLTLTACGSDTIDTGNKPAGAGGGTDASGNAVPTTATTDDAVAKLVPAKAKQKGTLVVGSDASYAPNEFLEGTTVKGMDVDIVTAAAQKMGLKVDFQNAQFDSIILNVSSGKFDLGASSFTINPKRKQQVNMISYFSAGSLWVTKKGNPKNVSKDNACGLNVGVQKGTVQEEELTAASQKCTSGGKQAIHPVVEIEQSKVTQDLVSGKVDAMAADSPIGFYAIQQTNGQLDKLGEVYDTAPYGIVLPKSDTELSNAFVAALESLKKDGTYQAILKKWGNDSGAVDSFKLNP